MEVSGFFCLGGQGFGRRRRRGLFFQMGAAFGAELEIMAHQSGADGTGMLVDSKLGGKRMIRFADRSLGRWRLQRIVERGLGLLGQLRAGRLQLGDVVAQLTGILRQLLGPEKNKGQYGEQNQGLKIDAEHWATPDLGLGHALPAMGAEGEVAGEILMALGTVAGLRRGAAGDLVLGLGGSRVIVGLFEAINGLADALSQLRQAPGAEEQQGDDQDDDEGGEIVTKHWQPLMAKGFGDVILIIKDR